MALRSEAISFDSRRQAGCRYYNIRCKKFNYKSQL